MHPQAETFTRSGPKPDSRTLHMDSVSRRRLNTDQGVTCTDTRELGNQPSSDYMCSPGQLLGGVLCHHEVGGGVGTGEW